MNRLSLTRRSALLGLSAAFTLGRASLALGAAPGDRRFVVVLLRGAMDGLSAVQPYGDPGFAALRGPLGLPQPGQADGLLDLGGFYGLHPALAAVHDMYAHGDALIVHAVAGHYRSRSHFEAQDYLESGADQRLSSGWLNRAVAAMPESGRDLALSVGLSAPLLLRGPARVESWAPDHFNQPDPDIYVKLAALSAHDPVLGPALAEGIRQRGLAASLISADPAGQGGRGQGKGLILLAQAAGKLLASPDGPRVAVLELGGWDTHVGQNARLAANFGQLDAALAALRTALGPAWRNTAVLAVTEFGRTARINGSNGTDHGTGGVALLMGGAVSGGKVLADWPGLGAGRLLEDRDLMPTADVRSVAKGVLAAHMGLGAGAMAQAFPGSADAAPMTRLIRA